MHSPFCSILFEDVVVDLAHIKLLLDMENDSVRVKTADKYNRKLDYYV